MRNKPLFTPKQVSSRSLLNTLTEVIPSQLPARRVEMLGRDEELRKVCELLMQPAHRLVTLTGFGGIGKTTLSLHAAHNLLLYFTGGVFFIDLSGTTNPNFILNPIARVLNLQEEAGRPLLDSLCDFIGGRDILFLLDNCEQVLDGGGLLSDLLDASPQLKILATSREPLRLRGEQVFPLTPLDTPAARELFTQCLRALNPAFSLDAESDLALTALCQKLDGMPLAIELAAQRAKIFSLPVLLGKLSAGQPALLNLLNSGARDLPPRQRTLRDTIAWSYALLTADEKRVLRAASHFRAGVDPRLLLPLVGMDEPTLLDALASLVEKNLMRSLLSDPPRFTLPDSICEFAAEQSHAVDEWAGDAATFFSTFEKLAADCAMRIEAGDPAPALNRLEVEHDNLLTALHQSLDAAHTDPAMLARGITLMSNLEQYWFPKGRFSEAAAFLERAMHACSTTQVPAMNLARLHGITGTLRWTQGNFTAAAEHHRQVIELAQQAGEDSLTARAFNNLAANLNRLNDVEPVVGLYLQALALSRKAGDLWNEVRVLSNLGSHAEQFLGQKDAALGYYQSALDLMSGGHGWLYERATVLFNMACLHYVDKNFEQSVELCDQVIEIGRQAPFPHLLAFGCGLRAFNSLSLPDAARAADFLREALQSRPAGGALGLLYELVEGVALWSLSRARWEAAARMLGAIDGKVETEPIQRTLPVPHGLSGMAARLPAQMGAEAFRRASQEGAQMSTDALTAFTLEILRADLPGPAAALPFDLTAREMDTLRLLARGLSNAEIARQMVVVPKTVEKHVANILRKMGASNRTEAVAQALEHGIK